MRLGRRNYRTNLHNKPAKHRLLINRIVYDNGAERRSTQGAI
jgi:hypothetical protein